MSHEIKLRFSVYCHRDLTEAVCGLVDIGKIPFVVDGPFVRSNLYGKGVTWVDVRAEGYGSGDKEEQIREYFKEIATTPEVHWISASEVSAEPSLEGDYMKDPRDSSKVLFRPSDSDVSFFQWLHILEDEVV